MAGKDKDQVDLNELIFTQSWEDPHCDQKAVQIGPGKRLMTITSGACNVLSFLAYDPEVIYAVDINPTQGHVLEIKMEAMRELDHAAFLQFLGLQPSPDRLEIYGRIAKRMSPEAKVFWDARLDVVKEGFLGKGKWEEYTRRSGGMMRMLQGKRRVNGLFEPKSAEEQRAYFDKRWDTWRLRKAFDILYSKRRLAKRGLKDDYFHFDDGSKSFAENFYRRHRNVMREVPVIGNYFVSLYLLGRYRNLQEVPEYLDAQHYDTIKSRLDRVHNIIEDAKVWLESQAAGSIDLFALSNICELMSLEDTRRTFLSVLHAGKDGSRISFRNLMIPRVPPEDLGDQIVRDDALSKEILMGDRSFVYSRVDAYTLRK